MRSAGETHAINRVLGSHGLGTLESPGTVIALALMVEDDRHFTELLRICEPELRREMYETMSPHLRFKPKPLEHYLIMAKEHAESRQFPVIDENGNLLPYTVPAVFVQALDQEFPVTCRKCQKNVLIPGQSRTDAVAQLRSEGWAYDEIARTYLCPECLDKQP